MLGKTVQCKSEIIMIVGKRWYVFWSAQSIFLDISGSQMKVYMYLSYR